MPRTPPPDKFLWHLDQCSALGINTGIIQTRLVAMTLHKMGGMLMSKRRERKREEAKNVDAKEKKEEGEREREREKGERERNKEKETEKQRESRKEE